MMVCGGHKGAIVVYEGNRCPVCDMAYEVAQLETAVHWVESENARLCAEIYELKRREIKS